MYALQKLKQPTIMPRPAIKPSHLGAPILPPRRSVGDLAQGTEPPHTVYIKSLYDGTWTVGCNLNESTVHYLKRRVLEKTGIPPANQRLIFATRQLRDDELLIACGIRDKCTVHVVFKSSTQVLAEIEAPPEVEPHPDTVVIIDLLNREVVIGCDVSWHTVRWLKQQLLEETGIPVTQQRLIFAGKDLEDHMVMSAYNIENRSWIHLVLILNG